MIDGVSLNRFRGTSVKPETKKKEISPSKLLLIGGATGLIGSSLIYDTKLCYPKAHKFFKYGIPIAALATLGYGIYKSCKNKSSGENKSYTIKPNDFGKTMLAGSALFMAYSPLSNLLNSVFISSRFSKNVGDFFKVLKTLLPQIKNHMHGYYAHYLGKIGIKNLSANKAILLGTLALGTIGAAFGALTHGIFNLVLKKDKK